MISGEMPGERSVRVVKVVKSGFLKILRKNKPIVEDRNKVVYKEEAVHGQGLLQNNFQLTWSFLLETFMDSRGV